MFPMFGSTAAMVHQLSADLFECLDCSWMLVATLAAGKPAALFVFGAPPSADCAISLSEAELVRPITSERGPGALAFGPKSSGAEYAESELELTQEFAAHIAKILGKDVRARSGRLRPA